MTGHEHSEGLAADQRADRNTGIGRLVATRPAEAGAWDLRHPITIIGSRRVADVVLRDDTINRVHAAIVDTGHGVLLADLMSTNGTFCNDRPVLLRILRHGDVIRVGPFELTVELEAMSPAARNPKPGADPLELYPPVDLVRRDTGQRLTLRKSVAVIGSRQSADVRIQIQEIALAHSLVHASPDGASILDLGSTTPLMINGAMIKSKVLRNGDCIAVGPVEMDVHIEEDADADQGLFRRRLLSHIRTAMSKIEEPVSIYHPGLESRFRDIATQELIRPLLPAGLEAVPGILMDASGCCSPHLDIIIYDRAALPPIMYPADPIAIPLEACVQVMDVRHYLDEGWVAQSLDKCRALRGLKPALSLGDRFGPISATPALSLFAYGVAESVTGEPWSLCQLSETAAPRPEDLCVVSRGCWHAIGVGPDVTPASGSYDEVAEFLVRILERIEHYRGAFPFAAYFA